MTSTVLTLLTALGLLIGIGLPISAGAQSYNWTGFYAGAQAGFAKPKDFVRYGGFQHWRSFRFPRSND